MPPSVYLKLLFSEIKQGAVAQGKHQGQPLTSIYFGGGTPSLLEAEDIVAILQELEKFGFVKGPATEVTIEINPATIQPKKLEVYLRAGINRFSVGAQTFDDALLKSVRREHNAAQTRETLGLLKSYDVNYSFDVLFALPGQSLEGLRHDLDEVEFFSPNHVSPYCLTVPEGHVLSKHKLTDDLQIEMFDLIRTRLEKAGYHRYEISNFAKPGLESKHNSLYWDDSEYWGIGLSAHSYSHSGTWGTRFWNASSIGQYAEQVTAEKGIPDSQKEILERHQSLTDFCHISLRRKQGLDERLILRKYGPHILALVQTSLRLEMNRGNLVNYDEGRWKLTEEGLIISNQVFSSFTYLKGELDTLPST